MFFKDALLQCSELEDEVASMYATLAALPAADTASAAASSSWAQAARKERQRARLLHAVAELSAALGDDGPFLVEVPLQLAALRKVIDRVRERVLEAVDTAGTARLIETLESARHGDLHANLLEVAEVEMRRVLRQIEAETRLARRSTQRAARNRNAVRLPERVTASQVS
jgi:hypothetical protein